MSFFDHVSMLLAAAIVALTVTREIRDMMIGDSEWMLLHPTFAVWLREEHALRSHAPCSRALCSRASARLALSDDAHLH